MAKKSIDLSPPDEPVLDSGEIQGLALPGYNKPHQTLIGFRLHGDSKSIGTCKNLLTEIADELTTLREAHLDRKEHRRLRKAILKKTAVPVMEPKVFWSIAFSFPALVKLTPSANDIPSPAFKMGLAGRSALLGDPSDPKQKGHPNQWIVGGPEKELDLLLVVAGDRRSKVDAKVSGLVNRFIRAGLKEIYRDQGDKRQDLPGHEHFGFDDGISQPGVRGRVSAQHKDLLTERSVSSSQVPDTWLYGLPGQDLVWPGEFVLGYPATSPDPLVPGPEAVAIPPWTRNGSFLVFRRLRQDVGLFWRTMRKEAKRLSKLPGFKHLSSDETLAALVVGRWPSGAPVLRSPKADNPSLGKNMYANNHFRFDSDTRPLPLEEGNDPFPQAAADPAGVTCPWAAHIRKVNTRDSGSDMGGRDSTYARRILRRGIPFGAPLKNRYADQSHDPKHGNRGLLFLSVQRSIEDQFEFLSARWMNDPSRPKMPGGHDLLVGQNPNPLDLRRRECVMFGSELQQASISTDHQWIVPTGGGYFFLPSISAIRKILGA